jgi:glucosamine--fructose-6-phosphate aminotransferase (isomerizing)
VSDGGEAARPGHGAEPGALVHAEMAEQPAVLARLLSRRQEVGAQVRRLVPGRPAGVLLLARGSSDHAAVYGRYLLELAFGVPVAMAAPSLLTRYHATPHVAGYLAIALSQSGRTPEIVDVLGQLRRAGATTLAITNDPAAPIVEVADLAVDLMASAERAVPATKTFTAQVAALAMVTAALADGLVAEREWAALPDAVAAVLDDDAPARAAAAALLGRDVAAHVARGVTYAVALEGALKMKETTGWPVEGFSSADFLHGPAAIAGPDTTLVAYAWPGPVLADVREAAERSAERGAAVIAACPSGVIPGAIELPVEADLGEAAAALPLVVRAQQLAILTALALGRDPDAPPGLRKVTPTA